MNKQWMQFADEVKAMYKKDFVPLHEPTFDDKEVEWIVSKQAGYPLLVLT